MQHTAVQAACYTASKHVTMPSSAPLMRLVNPVVLLDSYCKVQLYVTDLQFQHTGARHGGLCRSMYFDTRLR